ncbi:MAG: hypothetical protein Q4C87_04075 [Actinomycetaceae bacterium]|nr:hypothetical protein [Actinomycetaceae bacterium]
MTQSAALFPYPTTIVDLIALIRLRPGMWIGGHSISRLRIFIDGWFFGRECQYASDNPGHTLPHDQDILGEFTTWLQERHDLPTMSVRWDYYLLMVEPDEESALDLFFSEFDEYLSSQQHKH